jgi:hypothetical protein
MHTRTDTIAGAESPLVAQLIRLNDVPKIRWLPARRKGSRLHVGTVWRWATRGVRGQVLRTVRVGGTLCTSERWLMDFFEASANIGPGADRSRAPTARQRQRQITAGKNGFGLMGFNRRCKAGGG